MAIFNTKSTCINLVWLALISVFACTAKAQFFFNEQSFKSTKHLGAKARRILDANYGPVITFEVDKVPSHFIPRDGSSLSISKRQAKHGERSLKWSWMNGGYVDMDNPPGIDGMKGRPLKGMIMWVYLEKKCQAESLKFQIGHKNDVKSSKGPYYEFTFELNFTGWRALWIDLPRDARKVNYKGRNKELDGEDYVRIHAPDNTSGAIYIDLLQFMGEFPPTEDVAEVSGLNSRIGNLQMPYLKCNKLYRWFRTWSYFYQKPTLPLPELTPEWEDTLKKVNEGVFKLLLNTDLQTKKLKLYKECEEKFEKVVIKEGAMKGPPVFSKLLVRDYYDGIYNVECINLNDSIRYYFPELARRYIETKDKTHLDKFILGLDYLNDQGFSYGSGMMNLAFVSKHMLEFGVSVYQLRNEIGDERFSRTIETMKWMSAYNEIYDINHIEYDCDEIGGMRLKLLLTAIATENSELEKREKLQAYQHIQVQLSRTALPGIPTYGQYPIVRPDHIIYHHDQEQHSSYAASAATGLLQFYNIFYNTKLQLDKEVEASLTEIVKSYVRLSNTSGLPPIMGTRGLSQQKVLGMQTAMAKVLSDCGVDEFKQHLLWLKDKNQKPINSAVFGNWTYNFAGMQVHKRLEGMAVVRGISEYAFGTEIFLPDIQAANIYGQQMGFGWLQIIKSGDTEKPNGLNFNGWDWSKYPGATTVSMQVDEMAENIHHHKYRVGPGNIKNGGLSHFEKDGLFHLTLRDIIDSNDRPVEFFKNFYASKSYFLFDNVIICIGSDIANSNTEFPVVTTLIQQEMKKDNDLFVQEDGKVFKTISERKYLKKYSGSPLKIVDQYKNGYFIPNSKDLILVRDQQISKSEKDRLKSTKGDFNTLYFDHGINPGSAEYEYVVLPNVTKTELESFDPASYKILQKNSNAHIATFFPTGQTGYVLFGAQKINQGIIRSVNYPCLIMTEERDGLKITVADPALNYKDTKVTDAENLNQHNRTAKIKLEVDGLWKLDREYPECHISGYSGGCTELEFKCINGLSVSVNLKIKR